MSNCSWEMYDEKMFRGGKNRKRIIGKTTTPLGTCKIEANDKGVVEYVSCDAKNGVNEYWEKDQSIPQAKKAACNWLNTEGVKSSKRAYKDYKRKYQSTSKTSYNWPVLVGGAAVVGAGLLAYRILKK